MLHLSFFALVVLNLFGVKAVEQSSKNLSMEVSASAKPNMVRRELSDAGYHKLHQRLSHDVESKESMSRRKQDTVSKVKFFADGNALAMGNHVPDDSDSTEADSDSDQEGSASAKAQSDDKANADTPDSSSNEAQSDDKEDADSTDSGSDEASQASQKESSNEQGEESSDQDKDTNADSTGSGSNTASQKESSDEDSQDEESSKQDKHASVDNTHSSSNEWSQKESSKNLHSSVRSNERRAAQTSGSGDGTDEDSRDEVATLRAPTKISADLRFEDSMLTRDDLRQAMKLKVKDTAKDNERTGAAFENLDSNKSGKLEAKEMTHVEKVTKLRHVDVFDQDGDGKLSKKEFHNLGHVLRVANVFARYDKDHDRHLNLKEARNVAVQKGKAELNDIHKFDRYDQDKDNRLSFQEYLRAAADDLGYVPASGNPRDTR